MTFNLNKHCELIVKSTPQSTFVCIDYKQIGLLKSL